MRAFASPVSEVREDKVGRLGALVPVIVERMPRILTEVREMLADQHPSYAAFLAEEFDEVAASAADFVVTVIAMAEGERGSSVSGAAAEQVWFEEIGRAHYQQGQGVSGLLAAYRAGAAVAWRHIAEAALAIGIATESLAGLATAMFTAMDQLSADSLRGYLREESESVRHRERSRNELAELLLSDRSDPATVRAAAAEANWRLPTEAAVVVIEPDHEVGRDLLARLDADCLRLRRRDSQVAIVPDPSGPARRERLRKVLSGAGAVVGYPVSLEELPASMRTAQLAVRLRRANLLEDDPVFVAEHLDTLIVHENEELLAALRGRHLAALQTVPDARRVRLEETLRAWLMHMGNRTSVAEELHVHPQTVRYRLAQLRELLGSAIDDPGERAALVLAVAWGSGGGAPEQRVPAGGGGVRRAAV